MADHLDAGDPFHRRQPIVDLAAEEAGQGSIAAVVGPVGVASVGKGGVDSAEDVAVGVGAAEVGPGNRGQGDEGELLTEQVTDDGPTVEVGP